MRRWAAGLMLVLAPAWAQPARSGEDRVEANLEQAAYVPVDGPVGDVAVVGTTAVVASEACPPTVKVVDAKDPKRPKVASTVTLPAGAVAGDLDATAVDTPRFSGDLLAVALAPAPCGDAVPLAGGALYYDVTDPAAPRLLARTSGCEECGPATPSVSLAQRPDGRAVAARLHGPDALSVDDVTDPAHPTTLARWSVPRSSQPPACASPASASTVALHDDGEAILVVLGDGRIFDLDMTEPGALFGDRATPGDGGSSRFAAVLPLGGRTLAVVAQERGGELCPGEAGLRLLELSRGSPPVEVDPVRFTTPVAPGRLVASGELAYVAWHADGLRVLDLSQVKAVTLAQFKPPDPDVVGVAVLPEHVVVTDRRSGLYVLRRPDEGGPASTWWSQVVGLLPYLLLAAVMAAAFLVPRLAMGRAPVPTGAPAPVPQPARRRRHT